MDKAKLKMLMSQHKDHEAHHISKYQNGTKQKVAAHHRAAEAHKDAYMKAKILHNNYGRDAGDDEYNHEQYKHFYKRAKEASDHANSIKEDLELDENVLNIQQRQKRAQAMRRNQVKIEVARERAKKKVAPEANIKKRAYAMARQLVRSRYANISQAEYAKMGPSEKMAIDRLIEKKSKAIKKLAMRLVPKVKKAEYARLQSYMHGQQMANHGAPEGQHVSEALNNMFVEYFGDSAPGNSGSTGERSDNPISSSGRKVAKSDPKGGTAGNAKGGSKTKGSPIVQYGKFGEDLSVDSSEFRGLVKKSDKTEIDLEILGEVYNRGLDAWTEAYNVSPTQYAFARVNSYINQGKTYFNEDADLHEEAPTKVGDTVYLKTKKFANSPHSGKVVKVTPTHVHLKTLGGSGMYKAPHASVTKDVKQSHLHTTYGSKNEEVEVTEAKFVAHVSKNGKPHGTIRVSAVDQENAAYQLKNHPHHKHFTVDKLVKEENNLDEKRGLWDNIHAKQKRIKAGSGERMRKPGSKGAPSEADLKAAQESVEVDESKNTPYVKPHTEVGKTKQTAWKASNKHGNVKYFGLPFKKAAEKHAGLSEEVDESYFPGSNIEARVAAERQAKEKSKAANHPLDHHIKNALKNPYETAAGKVVKGALLGDIHDHVKEWSNQKISKRDLEDHLDRKYKLEQGYSRLGWTRKGQTKRSKARFYHNNETYMQEETMDEHIVKVKGGFELKSKSTGRNLGTYPTKTGAEKREKQVQYFKHQNEEVEEIEEGIKEKIKGVIRREKAKDLPLVQTRRDYAMNKGGEAYEKGNTRRGNQYMAWAERDRKKSGHRTTNPSGVYRTKTSDYTKEEVELDEVLSSTFKKTEKFGGKDLGQHISSITGSKHIGTMENGHDVYHSYDPGDKMHDYHVVDPKTKRVNIHLTTKQQKAPGAEEVSVLTANTKSLGAHHLYKHLVTKHDKIISSNDQSPGARKVWNKVGEHRGINIHGYDPISKKSFHMKPSDDEEYTDRDNKETNTIKADRKLTKPNTKDRKAHDDELEDLDKKKYTYIVMHKKGLKEDTDCNCQHPQGTARNIGVSRKKTQSVERDLTPETPSNDAAHPKNPASDSFKQQQIKKKIIDEFEFSDQELDFFLEHGVEFGELLDEAANPTKRQTKKLISRWHDKEQGQMYGDQPYSYHPKKVMSIGKKVFGTKQFGPATKKVALLHDTLEDTPHTPEDLKAKGFTPEVIDAVKLLSKDKKLSYKDSIERIANSGNRHAQMVKYADNMANFTGDKSGWDSEKRKASQAKYMDSMKRLGAVLGIKHHEELEESDKPSSRLMGTDSLVKTYKKSTPGQKLDEAFNMAFDYQGKPTLAPTASELRMQAQGGFAHHTDVQNVMEVTDIKNRIQKMFETTILEEDADQLALSFNELSDMVTEAFATINKIKNSTVERDAWSEAELLKLERYIQSVNAYINNMAEDVVSAEKAPVVVPAHMDSYGNVIPAKTVMRKLGRKIIKSGNVHNGDTDQPIA